MTEPRRIIISGCSGGGKSTLLVALANRGYKTREEAGRRVVQAELASGGDALPWLEADAFCEKALTVAVSDHEAAREHDGPVFFDRSVIDLLAYATRSGFALAPDLLVRAKACRYDQTVFMAPPWPEIFEMDTERQHSFEDAVFEYEHLLKAYPAAEHTLIVLPKTVIEDRVTFILNTLEEIENTGN